MFAFGELIRPKPKSDTSSMPTMTTASEPADPVYDASLRGIIFNTLENPSFSYLSLGLAWTQLVIVLLSVVTFMIGTLPKFWQETPLWLKVCEWIFGVYFTVDYVARLLTARKWYRWIYQPFNIIDFVSTAPFWIDLILKGVVKRLAVLRVLRLLRVFRVIRAAKAAVYVKILVHTLKNSRDALLLLLFVISVLVTLFSSVLFFAEQTGQRFNKTDDLWYRFDGSESPFQSIFHCMWWAITTITTTGYGDTYPVTLAGKLVGAACMLAGVVSIAFPIAVLGNNFSQAWNEFQAKKAQKKALKKVTAKKGSKKSGENSTEGGNSTSGDRPNEIQMNVLNHSNASDEPLNPAVILEIPREDIGPRLPTDVSLADPNATFAGLRDRETVDVLRKLKRLLNANDRL